MRLRRLQSVNVMEFESCLWIRPSYAGRNQSHGRTMSKNIETTARPISPDAPVYPEDVEATIQETLAILADDRTYQQRRDAIKKSATPIVQQKHLRAEVDSLYRGIVNLTC